MSVFAKNAKCVVVVVDGVIMANHLPTYASPRGKLTLYHCLFVHVTPCEEMFVCCCVCAALMRSTSVFVNASVSVFFSVTTRGDNIECLEVYVTLCTYVALLVLI